MKQRARQMLSKGQERQTDSVCVCAVSQQICWRFEARGFDIMRFSDTHTPEIFTLTFTLSAHLTTSHTCLKY